MFSRVEPLVWHAVTTVLAFGQVSATSVTAEEAPRPQSTPAMELHQSASLEAALLSALHSADQIEIVAGEQAWSRGTIGEIRNFGLLLVRDHSEADRRIQNVAKQQDIRLTEWRAETPEEQRDIEKFQQALAQLGSLNGPKFDRTFIELTDEIHLMLLRTLQRGIQRLEPSPVRTLVSKEIPMLQQHESLCSWCRNHCLNRELR